MIIKEMFQKDMERSIKGVIKVAQTDENNIYQELDEYVVTKELVKHLSKFYENYQKGIDGYTDKMGVWISGFFGSGKSHFLKILAYLLENKNVKDKKAIDFFEDKIQDPLILAHMKRTADVKAEVILFNIDSKSPLDSQSKVDAILRVFMKVFYEHQGFFGDVPGVAEMELHLTKQGVYEDFKREFKVLAGEEWVERRNSFYFDEDYVVGALTKVTNMSLKAARNWFENGVNHHEVSIEKFAKSVKEYIQGKGDNFHLIFLVDEIGQYIGDNQQLMLNLQTVTEDLGTYCNGKVWIMVTSQESIDAMIEVKGNDFSKIQGRFETKLSLSSISVDEVIKKRILLKKENASDLLRALFQENRATLKNLINFKESAADLRGYEDETEFADVYPFIPYQFMLLQNVFERVRRHGNSGKSLSEGERSMLSAFRESGLRYKESQEGALVPFYAFYDTMKEFLTPSVASVIEGAYGNPALREDEFTIEVLKVLFMIKYIKELPPNLENIATLMVTHMEEDKLTLKEKIQHSLRKLITQTMIQKNGEHYIFLTNDEQNVNREIRLVNIDDEAIKRELANYIFQDLYDEKKYRYAASYSFTYNQKMDEKNYGNQTSQIGLQILSPLSNHYAKSEQEFMMMTSGSGEMILKLGGNGAYIEEMEEVLKIEEYRKKRNPLQLHENIQKILSSKQAEAKERRRRVRDMLESAIKEGQFFINGNRLSVKGSSVKDRLNSAFKELVENVYTKLGLVKSFLESDKDLAQLLINQEEQITVRGWQPNINETARNEVYSFITLHEEIKKQMVIKTLLDRFSNKPYGWKLLDISGLIVDLLKSQRIRLRHNSEYLEPEDGDMVVNALTKSSMIDQVIVVKCKKVDLELLHTAKMIGKKVFKKKDLAEDEDGLVKDIRNLIELQITEINGQLNRYEGRKYPGRSLLERGLENLTHFHKEMDNVTFFSKLKELKKDLLEWEGDLCDVKDFWESNKRVIFDKGLLAYKRYQENSMYLTNEETERQVEKLNEVLTDPLPYKQIKQIPEIIEKIEQEIKGILVEKQENAKCKIKLDFDHLSLRASQYGVKAETKKQIETYYDRLLSSLDTFVDIFKVDATISQSTSFREMVDQVITRQLAEWTNSRIKRPDMMGETVTNPGMAVAVVSQKETVKVRDLLIVNTLNSEADIEKLINTLSERLKQIMKSNKQIELID